MAVLYLDSSKKRACDLFKLLLACIFRSVKVFNAFNRRLFNVHPRSRPDVLREKSTLEKSEIDGGTLPVRTSVFSYLEQGLSRNPHGLAVVSLHQPAAHLSTVIPPSRTDRSTLKSVRELESNHDLSNSLTMTYDQLHQGALKLATGLEVAGVKPDSKMLMLIPNGAEYALLMWCCIIMRLAYVCVDPDIVSVTGYNSLEDIMRSVQPSTVIAAGPAQAMAIDIAIEQLSLSPPVRVSLTAGASSGWRRLEDFVLNMHAENSKRMLDSAKHDSADRINSIIFTSGTSGTPKGCPLRVSSMCHILESQSWLVTEQNSGRALQTIHNSRGIAPFQTLQTWMAGGAVMMIKDSGNIEQMTEALRHHSPTFIAVSAAMVAAIQNGMAHDPFVANSVQRVQLGGEVIPSGAIAECNTLFPNAEVCINHGMTEGAGSFAWPWFERTAESLTRRDELLPIGKVASGSVVRIWDASKRCIVERGQPGELHIRGGNLIRQYLGNESSDSFISDESGRWFSTGDTAMIDCDGLVYILGRTKDMIITKQGAVVPATIETTIQKLTGAQAVVIAIEHARLGHMPVAVVKDFEKCKREDIMTYVVEKHGQSHQLAGVFSLKQLGLEDFPRNKSGKVSKLEIESAMFRAR